jgi:hypothetical protein
MLMQLFLTFNLSFCNLAIVLATFLKIEQFFFKLQVTLQGILNFREPKTVLDLLYNPKVNFTL